ncbi:hypothetical protein EDC94DRAFT_648369 [Helicostylum pulchrum]|nr:hypothetical protein EDC94DRAFT_648369 [Helicostylum pulchrum]
MRQMGTGAHNTVHGEIFLPEETDTYSIQRLNDDCPINTEKGTGLLNFDQTYTNAVYASEEFSRLPPTLLTSEDTLHTLGNPAEWSAGYVLAKSTYSQSAHPIKNQCIHPDDVNLTKHPVDMEREIQHGTSYEGVIRITRNRYDAYVTCDGLDADIFIGVLKSNRIVVQLVDIDTVWDRRKGRYQHRQQHCQHCQQQQLPPQQKNENAVESFSTVDLDEFADAEQSYKPAYCGEVIVAKSDRSSFNVKKSFGQDMQLWKPSNPVPRYQLLLDDVDKA